MIILKIKAGLGNQMFQYAYAYTLKKHSEKALNTSIPLKIDLSWFKEQDINRETERFYGLNHFNISASVATEEDIEKNFSYTKNYIYKLAIKILRKIQREVFHFSDYVFYPSMLKPKKNAYIDSYFWNSEKYFKDCADDIRNEFSLLEPLGESAKSAVKDIEEARALGYMPVLLTVRRGDYVSHKQIGAHHGAKDTSYYQSALSKLCTLIRAKQADKNTSLPIKLFITTDDVLWVRDNFHPKDDTGNALSYIFLSRPGMKDYEEIHVMSKCNHFVIANSTFHWWGAWLSQEAEKSNDSKIVIGPEKWVANPKIDTRDAMPKEWIRV